MSNIATTIEQSKHLLELGLPKETADMSYSEEYFGKNKDGNDEWRWRLNACKFVDVEGIIPAWSLSALFEVMPPFIKGHHLKVEKTRFTDMWYLDYQYLTDSEPQKDLLTAVYQMVCWLFEQGFIKKGGQQ